MQTLCAHGICMASHYRLSTESYGISKFTMFSIQGLLKVKLCRAVDEFDGYLLCNKTA